MAITNFIPEIWSANILEALRTKLVYGGPGVVNRDYEGEIANAGDTVNITSFTDPTVRDYTVENDITVDAITDSQKVLTINQQKYFAFDVDDVNRRQALSGWVASVTGRAGYKLAVTMDSFISNLMYTAVNQTSEDIGAVVMDISNADGYGLLLIKMWEDLSSRDVPMEGRFIIVPPTVYGALLQDARFINAAASGSSAPLRNGEVGTILGFNVMLSNTVPQPTSGTYAVLAGHPMATTVAEQILSTEAARREKRFGDLIKGLHVYGGKVVRPEALSLASVTVQA